MKFATLALIGAASAVKITSTEDAEGPSCEEIGEQILHHCDKDHSRTISWKEARACGAPKHWKKEFDRVAGKDHEIDGDEFMAECRKHINGLAEETAPSCEDIGEQILKHCDRDHSRTISWAEARACGAPKGWKKEFDRVAGKDGEVDEDEFMAECEKHHPGLAEEEEGDRCEEIGEQILHHCDKNGNDKISWKEARACGAPKKWKKRFLRVAGKDRQVDGDEFLKECRRHHGLAEEGDKCEDIGEQILHHCDKDHSDTISWAEARACGAPKHWKKEFDRVAGKDGEVDGEEFLEECRKHM